MPPATRTTKVEPNRKDASGNNADATLPKIVPCGRRGDSLPARRGSVWRRAMLSRYPHVRMEAKRRAHLLFGNVDN
jgi:hypothetical protein